MVLPLPGQCPPSTRDPEATLAELAAVAAQLAVHLPIVEALYARRDELYVEAREGFPTPITQRVLAAHSDVSEEAVTATLRRINQRRSQAATTQETAG